MSLIEFYKERIKTESKKVKEIKKEILALKIKIKEQKKNKEDYTLNHKAMMSLRIDRLILRGDLRMLYLEYAKLRGKDILKIEKENSKKIISFYFERFVKSMMQSYEAQEQAKEGN